MSRKKEVRQEFRESVFSRDGDRCIVPECRVSGRENLDAHHLIGRKSMPDGGYNLDNGVSLCKTQHHMDAEKDLISVSDIRRWIGTLDGDYRHKFRKFPKVQKHPDFTNLENGKYSNTVGWPFVDDHFSDDFIVEEKLDGSNVGIGFNGDGTPFMQTRGQVIDLHTMNVISDSYEKNVKSFRDWVWTNLEIVQKLPQEWMVYGEWLRYKHTVPYDSLPSFFIAFAVHDGNDFLMPDDARRFLSGVGFETPPLVSLMGIKSLNPKTLAHKCRESAFSGGPAEGVVIKSTSDGTIIKWVQPGFRDEMERHGHWRHGRLGDNYLAGE